MPDLHPLPDLPQSPDLLDSPAPYAGCRIERGAEVRLRDGVVLRADVYRPADDPRPRPVLLVRTPYDRRDPGVLGLLEPEEALRQGFLLVVQDVRGRFGSEGRWRPAAHERADGDDSVRWAARLPGADGRVAMYGPSYLGHVQWAALAAGPPELRAVAPAFTWSAAADGLLARGGARELGLTVQWTLGLGPEELRRRHAAADPPEAEPLARQLAALEAALADPGDAEPLARYRLPVPADTPAASADHTRGGTPAAPVHLTGGWYDCFSQGVLDAYTAARRAGRPVALVMGPWSHNDQGPRVGGVDHGPGAAAAAGPDGGPPLRTRELAWLAAHLGPAPDAAPGRASAAAPSTASDAAPSTASDAAPSTAPDATPDANPQPAPEPEPEPPDVLVFATGENRWHRLPDWPPPAGTRGWHLRAGGLLTPEPPGPDEGASAFDHDPDHPVPALGGPLLLTDAWPPGPLDQRPLEARPDVLVHTSAPLTAPLPVVGRIRARLHAESTAPGADWVVRLCDVDPAGASRFVADGILRTEAPPGVPAEHTVDLWSAAHVFRPGHRLRVHIAATSHPRWDVHPARTPARQTVHHTAPRPSRLDLPVPDPWPPVNPSAQSGI